MCVCNSNDGKYEVVINDINDCYICSVFFKSITTVCRFLEDACLANSKIDVVRVSDTKLLDIDMLLSIWNDVYRNEV